MYQDCETCEYFGNCGCDDLRERAYLHRESKDCYKPNYNAKEGNTKTVKTPIGELT